MAERKETRSIADFISDVAYRKRRAAQARFAGTVPGQESSRDVYLAACASIGAYLEESFGFKYAKSGPHARRRSGDLTFQVGFETSFHNISGEHVYLSINGNVWSSRINKWRKSNDLYGTDYVAGGQIGNLQVKPCWLQWELADPDKRDEVIRDAIRAIEELAFPYFAKFEDLPALSERLVLEGLPAMSALRVIEFLICFDYPSKAHEAASRLLSSRPDLVQAYQLSYARYAERKLSLERPAGDAEQLAFASHAFKFGDLSAAGTSS